MVIPQWLPRPLNIVRADLKGKWLVEVNLRDAYAYLANLEGTDLTGADLQGANLQGAELRGVKNLTQEQLQAAQIDAHTQLPEALPRLAPGEAAAPPSEPPQITHE